MSKPIIAVQKLAAAAALEAGIRFKVFIHTMDNCVIINHEIGVVHTPMKDLMRYPDLHPDLVEAAMTSVREMARKYNGVSDEETDSKQAAGEGQSQQAAAETQLSAENNSEAGAASSEPIKIHPFLKD